MKGFLPTTTEEMKEQGITQLDFIYVGDGARAPPPSGWRSLPGYWKAGLYGRRDRPAGLAG